MRDCKYCGSPLAYDNHTNMCYTCRRYAEYVEQEKDTAWLEESANNPSQYMRFHHVAIIRDEIARRRGNPPGTV